MKISVWNTLIDSLWDEGHPRGGKPSPHALPGPRLQEWLGFVQHDMDEVDQLYLDHDTCGGE